MNNPVELNQSKAVVVGSGFWWHHSFIVFGNQINKEDEALPILIIEGW